jgi:RimJ/RimL family protein N-acetyltransferase
MQVETDRLVIRTYAERDAEAWLALVNDPNVTRFLPPRPSPVTLKDFQEALQRRHAMEQERRHAMWAVELKKTGAFIGQCGLYPAELKGPEVELAYHFKTASWGKGYATEAAIAVLHHAFGPVGLDRVIAIVMPANIGSCRVVEKAGMRFEGSATYYEIPGLRKYVADRESWRSSSS